MSQIYPDFFTENIKQDLQISEIQKLIPLIEDKINYSLLKNISGPLRTNSHKKNVIDFCIEYNRSIAKGNNHIKINEYQFKYGDNRLGSNIQIPIVEVEESTNMPVLRDLYVISHPDDCERIANLNIKKLPNFKPIVADSIISTTNNSHWKEQRHLLNDGFLPSILVHLFSESNNLAISSVEKLSKRVETNYSIDLNDFLLELTQEQLQRVLLGMSNDFTDKTNKNIRNAFNGKGKRGYTRDFAFSVLDQIKNNIDKYSLDSNGINGVNGPISYILGKNLENISTETYGNIVLLAFAGHDTTGHTLTWLIYELSRNPKLQNKLRSEVDNFWENHNQTNLKYEDLKKLPFMTKCIHETLRLWPAVANGTFRQLEKDTYIKGHNNKNILLPKDSYTQIFNWSRHRNKELWGEDADIFNPDREWKNNEIWGNAVFSAYNPSSSRFSPFSYGPRDCLGKNFAQMEMRLILLYLIKNFVFFEDSLGKSFVSQKGYNRATLAPINNYADHNYPDTLLPILETGCYINVIQRNINSKL